MELHVEQGTLLAAGPDMLDPNFMHAVVLICQHSGEGAYGLVVNRLAKHTTKDVLSDELALGRLEVPLYIGGPVGLDTLQVLHRAPARLQGGAEIVNGIWIGADLESLGAYAREAPGEFRRYVRLVLGYSGWGEGQLEGELGVGVWLPAACSAEQVFGIEPARLWRTVVRSIGVETQGLDDQPPDPQWN